jgi:hypothetical protein
MPAVKGSWLPIEWPGLERLSRILVNVPQNLRQSMARPATVSFRPERPRRLIGIDLGTTNCLIAHWVTGTGKAKITDIAVDSPTLWSRIF